MAFTSGGEGLYKNSERVDTVKSYRWLVEMDDGRLAVA